MPQPAAVVGRLPRVLVGILLGWFSVAAMAEETLWPISVESSASPSAMALNSDGERLAIGLSNGEAMVIDSREGSLIRRWTAHPERINAVCFLPGCDLLATAGDGAEIRLWNLREPSEPTLLTGHSSWIMTLAVSSDGGWLASGSYDRTVRLWNLGTGENQSEILSAHQGAVRSVAFSAEGRHLASGSADRTAILWDVERKRPLKTFTGHGAGVRGVRFSPDGSQLATASEDGAVRLWNVESRERIRSLTGHAGMVWSLAYSDDGTRLASGGFDQTLRVWNAQTGKRLAVLRGPKSPIVEVTFARNGKALFVAAQEPTLRRYSLPEASP